MVPSRLIPFLLFLPIPVLVGGEHSDTTSRADFSIPAEQGRIAGKVEVSSALVSRRPRFRIYASAGPGAVPPAPTEGDDLARELGNVVVYLVPDSARPAVIRPKPLDKATAVMAQRGERFEPHVLPVVQGTRVEFPNHDDVYHNVFSLSSASAFDLGRFPKGQAKDVIFRKPGLVQVFCHIHSDMSGIVLVLPNGLYAAPSKSGDYDIDGVPPGEYVITGWHERTKPVTQRIRVVAGETTTINFSLPIEPGAQP
jgi:plastocyanin